MDARRPSSHSYSRQHDAKLLIADPKKARRYFVRMPAFTIGPVEFRRWLKERGDIGGHGTLPPPGGQ
jgi:hypothetical protein